MDGEVWAEVSEEAIARAISAAGSYQVEIKRPSSQCLVDLHWAALKAARRLGCKVSIRVGKESPRSPVSVTVSRN